MSLVEKLDNDYKHALKTRNQETLGVLRLVRSSIKNLEIEKQAQASDEDVIEILQREIKQHKETIESLARAGRDEAIARQTKEVTFLESYLPEQLSPEALRDIIEHAITETNASTMKDMGHVMGTVMPQVKGKATGDSVGHMVRELLSGK